MVKFSYIRDLIALANERKTSIAQIVVQYEAKKSQQTEDFVRKQMKENWQVMKESAHAGIAQEEKSASGLVGGDALKINRYLRQENKSFSGATILKAASYAIAVSEVNALMGKIVACPTAGSCGILPAAILSAIEKHPVSEEKIIEALFTAAGVGMIIAQNASIAGAQGGCQAECGSAAGMAAAALVCLADGTPEQTAHGIALAIKNLLGLVCDPVAGLVEVPCVKRNGFAAVHAMLAADMALAGVESVIPVDEIIEAMYKIGLAIPKSLRETSQAGLADTPTARKFEAQIHSI